MNPTDTFTPQTAVLDHRPLPCSGPENWVSSPELQSPSCLPWRLASSDRHLSQHPGRGEVAAKNHQGLTEGGWRMRLSPGL